MDGQFYKQASSYNSIDLAKFFMAFCVIAIHTQPLVNCNNDFILSIYDSIVRLAVPFFFITSGFLLEKKCDGSNDTAVIGKQMNKILRMYLIWTLIYTPLEIVHAFSSGTSLIKEILLYFRDMVFVGEHYNSWPLWYLLSTIYGLALIYYVKKKKLSAKGLLVISIVFMMISFGIDSFVSIDNLSGVLFVSQKLIKLTIGNGRILQGLFFISLGMLLSEKSNAFLSTLLFVFGFIGNCLLDGFIGSIFLTISAVGLFGIIKNIKLSNTAIWKHLREYSTIIYLIHMYVWTIYYVFAYGRKTFGIDSFIFTSIVSLIISIVSGKCEQDCSYVEPSISQ